MEKEKVLEIEFKEVWDNEKNSYAWRFIKNDLKGDINFSTSETMFELEYGLIQMKSSPKELDYKILISKSTKEQLETFVKEVNEKYGIVKRWRASEKCNYYFIDYDGSVVPTIEEHREFDNVLYEYGNYFQTQEEAKKYAEKIEKMLQERE